MRGVAGIPEIWSEKVSVPNKNVWRPLPQTMFAVEYELFGANALPGHLISAICYGLLCAVVFLFLRVSFSTADPWYCFAAALLFAVHPLHTEVVANIKSRDEILAMLFGLWGIMALLRAARNENWLWAIAGISLFGLALLSKSNAITLVAVMLLAHWYVSAGRIWERATLIPLIVATALIAVFSEEAGWGVLAGILFIIYGILAPRKAILPGSIILVACVFMIFQGPTPIQPENGYSLVTEASALNNVLITSTQPELVQPTAIANVARSIGLVFYPHPLIHLYGHAQVPLLGYDAPLTWLSIAMIALAGIALIFGIPRRSPVAFGLFFFTATFSIYSNLWVTLPDTMADRYLFMPLLGLCMVVVFGFAGLMRLDRSNYWKALWRNWLAISFIGVVCIVLSTITLRTNMDWKTDASLIDNRIEYMQNNAAAHAMQGFVRYQDARAADDGAKFPLYQQALEAFHRALVIYPDFFTAWQESGKVFAEVGDFEKAELCFLRSVLIEPQSPDGYGCLGTLYFQLGAYEMAIPYLRNTLILSPGNEPIHELLGFCLVAAGKYEALGTIASQGLQAYPTNPNFLAMQAMYKAYLGMDAAAYQDAQTVLRVAPDNVIALSVIARLTEISQANR